MVGTAAYSTMNFIKQLVTPKSDLSGVYSASVKRLLNDEVVQLSSYKGKVLIVVNVASE